MFWCLHLTRRSSERAVELARLREQPVREIAQSLGISELCPRNGMAQTDIDAGDKPGLSGTSWSSCAATSAGWSWKTKSWQSKGCRLQGVDHAESYESERDRTLPPAWALAVEPLRPLHETRRSCRDVNGLLLLLRYLDMESAVVLNDCNRRPIQVLPAC